MGLKSLSTNSVEYGLKFCYHRPWSKFFFDFNMPDFKTFNFQLNEYPCNNIYEL